MDEVKQSRLGLDSVTVTELATIELCNEALDILRLLRPDLDDDKVLEQRDLLMANGYRLFGLHKAGRIICVAGVVLHPHLIRGAEFWVHDLVTLEEERSKGYGKAMMQHLERVALESGCSRLLVHTRIEREQAQHFYERHMGFETYAIVYQKAWSLNEIRD